MGVTFLASQSLDGPLNKPISSSLKEYRYATHILEDTTTVGSNDGIRRYRSRLGIR